MNKPVYVFSGFLDAGKTKAIKSSLDDNQFNQGEKTLIVAFEKGDEEFDDQFLTRTNSEVVYIDSLADWNKEKQKQLDNEYKPERVVVEINGMFNDADFYKIGFISNWELAQRLTFADASSFKLYMNNMSQIMYNHLIYAELVVFNRADNQDLRYLRNNVKAINPRISVIFEDRKGNITQQAMEEYFDLSKPLNISDYDFGIWYMDAVNDSKKYHEKEIELNSFYIEDVEEEEKVCIFGRKAMVCCEQDIKNIGFSVVTKHKKDLEIGKYYHITGKIKTLKDTEGYDTCVIFANEIKEIEPNNELVKFN